MNPVDKILNKQKIVYQNEDGQIYKSPKGGYDIVTFGKNQKEKYNKLVAILKKGDKKW